MSLNLEFKKAREERAAKKVVRPKMEVVNFKSTTEEYRWRIEQMQKNPERAAALPQPKRERGAPKVRDFNPNVQGSSAGAGSGEFHVYRHEREREYARQAFLNAEEEKRLADEAYMRKKELFEKEAEEKTAKKRAKRQRQKQKKQLAKKIKMAANPDAAGSDDKDSEGSKKRQRPDDDDDEEPEEQHFVVGGK
eukprot:m.80461 g.80461  ORF g.80461 m.80461 type:complete len:193 (-) comp14664_c0_seq2:150-728(-)